MKKVLLKSLLVVGAIVLRGIIFTIPVWLILSFIDGKMAAMAPHYQGNPAGIAQMSAIFFMFAAAIMLIGELSKAITEAFDRKIS